MLTDEEVKNVFTASPRSDLPGGARMLLADLYSRLAQLQEEVAALRDR